MPSAPGAPLKVTNQTQNPLEGDEGTIRSAAARPGWVDRLPRFLTAPFIRDAALLGASTAMGQSFAVLVSPLLSRLYLPEDMSRFGLYFSFVTFAVVTASLQYESAIVSAKSARDSSHLVLVAIGLILPTSLLATLLLYSLIHFSWLGFGNLPLFALVFVLPSLLLSGAFTTLRFWSVREASFAGISRSLLWQGAMRAATQVGLGLLGLGWLGLVGGDLAGRGFGVGKMLQNAWKVIVARVRPIQLNSLSQVLKDYFRFPLLGLPSALLNSLAATISLPLVVLFYGTAAGGFFALVRLVLAFPVGVVGQAVADVFHGRLAGHARETPHRSIVLFYRVAAVLLAGGLLPAGILFFYGEPIFSFVFGSRWLVAGLVAQAMAPWFLAQLVVSPLSRAVFVYEGQHLKLIYDGLALSCVIGVLWLSHLQGMPFVLALKVLSWIQVLVYAVYFLLLVRLIRQGPRVGRGDEAGPSLGYA